MTIPSDKEIQDLVDNYRGPEYHYPGSLVIRLLKEIQRLREINTKLFFRTNDLLLNHESKIAGYEERISYLEAQNQEMGHELAAKEYALRAVKAISDVANPKHEGLAHLLCQVLNGPINGSAFLAKFTQLQEFNKQLQSENNQYILRLVQVKEGLMELVKKIVSVGDVSGNN